MKKQMIAILFLLAGGFALPASAQHFRDRGCHAPIVITGYRACGTPVFARKLLVGRSYKFVPLRGRALRSQVDQWRRLQARRDYERRVARERLRHARRVHPRHYRRYETRFHPNYRRCR